MDTSYLDLLRPPDRITLLNSDGIVRMDRTSPETWTAPGADMSTHAEATSLTVDIEAPHTPLERIHLRWQIPIQPSVRLLGDAWERGYGDLGWHGLVPERPLPWYFLSYDGRYTHGYGVKTAPAAFCFWRVDSSGVSLWLDVRCGGDGVVLGQRRLHAVDIVARRGTEGETPFSVAQALCSQLCPHPRLPSHPVYGSNNWYYAYGHSSHEQIVHDTALLLTYTTDTENRPYMVIDAGWQANAIGHDGTLNACCGGPWTQGNALFPDMPGLATRMRDMGARPGLWLRPLAAMPGLSPARLLPGARVRDASAAIDILDPSIAENLALVASDIHCVTAWGYELVKHDWTTCDILGRWGFDMGTQLTNPGWHFADRSRTTAEIMRDLFRTIRAGAGDTIIIGCNTVGHLTAGLFELQRTGDDTSGIEWERTRKMGVNTLAFRMVQHGAFFAADADCVGLTSNIPWDLNRQWLDLLARSGTPLFVSASPDAVGTEQAEALQQAFALASREQPVAEPLDWLDTTCPQLWSIGDDRFAYDWYGLRGIETV